MVSETPTTLPKTPSPKKAAGLAAMKRQRDASGVTRIANTNASQPEGGAPYPNRGEREEISWAEENRVWPLPERHTSEEEDDDEIEDEDDNVENEVPASPPPPPPPPAKKPRKESPKKPESAVAGKKLKVTKAPGKPGTLQAMIASAFADEDEEVALPKPAAK